MGTHNIHPTETQPTKRKHKQTNDKRAPKPLNKPKPGTTLKHGTKNTRYPHRTGTQTETLKTPKTHNKNTSYPPNPDYKKPQKVARACPKPEKQHNQTKKKKKKKKKKTTPTTYIPPKLNQQNITLT